MKFSAQNGEGKCEMKDGGLENDFQIKKADFFNLIFNYSLTADWKSKLSRRDFAIFWKNISFELCALDFRTFFHAWMEENLVFLMIC